MRSAKFSRIKIYLRKLGVSLSMSMIQVFKHTTKHFY